MYILDQLRNIEALELFTYYRAAPHSSTTSEGVLVPARRGSSLDFVVTKLIPILGISQTNLVEFTYPRMRRLEIGLAEATGEPKRNVLALIKARRRKDRDRGLVRWLEEVVVRFDEGSVDGMRGEPRTRGVDTRGVQFTVRGV